MDLSKNYSNSITTRGTHLIWILMTKNIKILFKHFDNFDSILSELENVYFTRSLTKYIRILKFWRTKNKYILWLNQENYDAGMMTTTSTESNIK